MKQQLTAVCAGLMVLGIAGSANATTLESRLGGLAYYDPVANLTWLADAGGASIERNWADANAWAASLNVDGVTGWRLPTTTVPDASCDSTGFNCTGSEMGNLFYNTLGNTAGGTNLNTGPFSNYGYGITYYWTATEYDTNSAWYFHISEGLQGYTGKGDNIYAWAVHSGDVSPVPVPAAAWLFGSGIIGLIGVARRKKR